MKGFILIRTLPALVFSSQKPDDVHAPHVTAALFQTSEKYALHALFDVAPPPQQKDEYT